MRSETHSGILYRSTPPLSAGYLVLTFLFRHRRCNECDHHRGRVHIRSLCLTSMWGLAWWSN